MAKSILVIDDEISIRQSLGGALKDEGYEVRTAASGVAGIDRLRESRTDIVILDIWMPDLDGLETLKRIMNEWPDQTVIMMSGHGTIETAVRAVKLGAWDFVEKPLSLERLLVLIQNAANNQDLLRENQALRKQVRKPRDLIGNSPSMKAVRDLVRQVAPTTGSVLITGENGTGKELVAQLIHTLSPRFTKPFIEVNCAAIPEELIESELFGHEKGAFTGATQLRRGKFDLAHGGTLFLDEIGDMSLKTQAKILRILQEQKFERVGGGQSLVVDVRIVAATNKDLRAEIAAGNFREDLFYRLNVIPFQLPPLRERKEDIVPLAEHFLAELVSVHGRKPRSFAEDACAALRAWGWPGNVRELRNLVERLVILTPEAEEGTPIQAATLIKHLKDAGMSEEVIAGLGALDAVSASVQAGSGLKGAKSEFEREFILKTLRENEWNISKTAQILGIERSYLHRKMKAYGIESDG
jgi:two-component system nitrogen regulation response regulator NtrX